MSFFPAKSNAELIDKIVAQVGTQIITLHDVQKYAPALVYSINIMETGEEKDAAWQRYYDEAIEQIVYDKTLEIAASRFGVGATEEEIENMIVVLQEQNTQFRNHVLGILEREGVVTPELFLYAKQVIISNKIQMLLRSRVIVTESDIMDHIRKEQSDFQIERTEYDVDLVFLSDSNSLEALLGAMDNGSSLEQAVAAGNADSTQLIDMGWLYLEQISSASMQRELLKLQDGEISKGFDDGAGRYLVIRRNDTRKNINIPDAERERITNLVGQQQLGTIFMNWLDRQKQSIVVNRYP